MVALTVGGNSGAFSLKLFRGSTEIGSPSSGTRPAMIHRYTAAQYLDSNIINFLDSPNTTSATTYALGFRKDYGSQLMFNRPYYTNNAAYHWNVQSQMVCMEVKA